MQKYQSVLRVLEKYRYPGNWHPAIFFFPIVIYWIGLAIWNRCFSALYSNPGLPYSGHFDDSKTEIHELFSEISSEYVLATGLIPAKASISEKLQIIKDFMQEHDLTFPIILKPDRGLRGIGVKVIDELSQAHAYLTSAPFQVVVQEYCGYENEGCLYFYRHPETDRCEILGSTLKIGPEFTGDGFSTLEEIIDRTPFVRDVKKDLQVDGNLDLQLILKKEEKFRPNVTPCISVGGRFESAERLLSANTRVWMQEITDGLSSKGVKIGRFDVKFENENSLKTGEGVKILELNGAAAELNELYDTNNSLFQMYRLYFRQLRYVFWIGKENLKREDLPYIPKIQLFKDFFRFSKLKQKMTRLDEFGFSPNVRPWDLVLQTEVESMPAKVVESPIRASS